MTRIGVRWVGVLAVMAMSVATQAKAAEGITAKAAFEKIKTLAGEWKLNTTAPGHEHDKKTVSFKLAPALPPDVSVSGMIVPFFSIHTSRAPVAFAANNANPSSVSR